MKYVADKSIPDHFWLKKVMATCTEITHCARISLAVVEKKGSSL
ncbi:hypothetical protein [Hydrocarboniphaga effusa]